MTRFGAVFWLVLVLAAVFTTFKVKYAVQNLEDELNRVRKQTIAERQEIRVLTAEWTYLNQPERLAEPEPAVSRACPDRRQSAAAQRHGYPVTRSGRFARCPGRGEPRSGRAANSDRPGPDHPGRAWPGAGDPRADGRGGPPRRCRPAATGESRTDQYAGQRAGEQAGLARRADRANCRRPLMLSAQRLDENPCRPRHFRPPPPCAPVIADERAAALLETFRTRLVAAAALFALVFMVVALRLVDVVVFSGASAEPHFGPTRPVAPLSARSDIIDRNGELLATTLYSPSLYADPRQIIDAREATRAITSVLPQLDPAEIQAKLTSGKSFVWIKRELTPRQEYEINRLGIPGLQFRHEERRVYPLGNLAAHVVGFCGIDNNGLAGIERGLDSRVRQSPGPIQLSLDARVQFILHEELQKVIDDFSAKGAAGIIMDVRTGEVIAMVSLPDFDPNHPGKAGPDLSPADAKERTFNKATLGDYEMGSVMKIFNTAMALDSGTAAMTSQFDASHDIRVGRFTIEDYHGKHRWLSVPEIFMYSSNIGSARMALAAGETRQQEYLSRFGLLTPAPIELDEVATPHYPHPWHEINVMTIAFGHGMSVSPLNVITAASAVVNGGILHPATLLKLPPGTEPPGVRVISPRTSEEMRKLLRLVVEYGTARFAETPGYVVGGKTGTAEKNKHGRYELKKLVSSFVGVFPMNDPRYAVLTLVDEPHGTTATHGYATAGWTVVPATKRIIQRIAPILGVQPVDETAPAIVQALAVKSLQGERIEAY